MSYDTISLNEKLKKGEDLIVSVELVNCNYDLLKVYDPPDIGFNDNITQFNFDLERKSENGKYTNVEVDLHTSIVLNKVMLIQPQESHRFQVNISNYVKEILAGKYRIKISYIVESKDVSGVFLDSKFKEFEVIEN